MPTELTLALIVVAIVVGTVLIAEAAIRTVRAFRGIDETAVSRRLSQATEETRTARLDLFQQQKDMTRLRDVFIPYYQAISRYLAQAGTPMAFSSVVLSTACLAVGGVLLLWLMLPVGLEYLALPCGVLGGFACMFLYISKLRAKRMAMFEEQLPDAIELIVRSLRVGHPVSVAVAAVAQEMPAPIGVEFAAANAKITYGLTVPDAFKEMHERVPLPDLGFLVVAFQIQSESGGNLVESLAKLSGVIRDRFRMFRKVKSMTAEGRLSAWLLSIFPFAIGLAISLVRPGYYHNIAQLPYFGVLAVVTVAFLILNVLVMMVITKIRV
jgi:tight adherence protein B